MPVPYAVEQLVERFAANIDEYKDKDLGYNETETRIHFIDPFFQSLGWDIRNEKGKPEAYRDVLHEAKIALEKQKKSPDYAFRIGGQRRFFVEAKKPSINIYKRSDSAFQTRRYGWSAGLSVSILTDFEEFAIYDCRTQPKINDAADRERVKYYTYTDYIEQWDEIYNIFSFDAVESGSIDSYISPIRPSRGIITVDEAFLRDIEAWRESLAKNIAHWNPRLDKRALNTAVQLTLDRIIFLRICEERDIEPYGKLLDIAKSGEVYKRLVNAFKDADDRYNSGLFHFNHESNRGTSPDIWTPSLYIDNEELFTIINKLYYPSSPYAFSVIPVEILGQVYEQFLGKVIQVDALRSVSIEDKPEVKKAGGIFYTPTYIVDYIVKHTIGPLIKDKMPIDLGEPINTKKTKQKNLSTVNSRRLTILDPSCGSGSFLLGAYQYLLDWYLQWYIDNDPNLYKKEVYQADGGLWKLTVQERKRILTSHIYGVDIDAQAVEVTKLSLILKVLEGETAESIDQQMLLFRERALPDLDHNIKCGNSLISSDFYDMHPSISTDPETRYQVNCFDWDVEFKSIMQNGGFSAIIGNPPWGASFTENELAYLRVKNHTIIKRMIDSFMYFVYQSLEHIKDNGLFGMILPDVILYQIDNSILRKYILEKNSLLKIINTGNVFKNVVRPSSIIIAMKNTDHEDEVISIDISQLSNKPKEIENKNNFINISYQSILDDENYMFLTSNKEDRALLDTIISRCKTRPLSEFLDEDGIQRGASPDLKEAFIVDDEIRESWNLESEKLQKTLTGGKHIKRYYIVDSKMYLIYTSKKDNMNLFPNICAYIDSLSEKITCREVLGNKHSIYVLHRPRNEKIFIKPQKIVGVITDDEIIVALDNDMFYVTDGVFLFGVNQEIIDIHYIMAVLNSNLFIFIYRLYALEKGRVLPQVKPAILKRMPICIIGEENIYLYNNIIELVKEIIYNYKESRKYFMSIETDSINRHILSIKNKIDKLVYQIYKLSPQEINEIENLIKD